MILVSTAKMLGISTWIRRVRNKIMNTLATVVAGNNLSVDWSGLKIIHPENMIISNNFSSGRNLWLESVNGIGKIEIGNNVNISDYVHIASLLSVKIGNGVLIGSKVLITDHSHGDVKKIIKEGIGSIPPNLRTIISKGPVVIEDNVWLGDGVCVIGSVNIGEGAVIGANAVIVKNVPAFTVWGGVPAKQIYPINN